MNPQTVDSEWGTLREVALCVPENYDWAAENAIVASSRLAGKTADRPAALRQHAAMARMLAEIGINCRLLTPDPHLPMQVFTRDSAMMTPWGLLITQLARPERRGEYVAVQNMAATLDLPVWQHITAGSLEGGDIQVLRPGEVLIGVSRTRTTPEAARQLSDWVDAEGWQARLVPVPPHFLHLDVLFSVLNGETALYAVDLLNPEDVSWLEKRFELIPIGYRDVMRMGCNVTALGDGRVLSSSQHPALNATLRERGFELLVPDLEQFVLEGGAAHCLTMPLRRDPA